MPEADELIIDATRQVGAALRNLWQRQRGMSAGDQVVRLNEVKPRLELLVDAVFGRPLPIRVAPPMPPISLARWLFARDGVSAVPTDPLPACDGNSIYLPPVLSAGASSGVSADDYSLLAVLQAIRCQRASTEQHKGIKVGLVSDLFLLAECVACDGTLRRLLPGWARALEDLYCRMLASLRQEPSGRIESMVRGMYRDFLGGTPPLPPSDSAKHSLEWAESCAGNLRRQAPSDRYVPWLGDLVIGRLLVSDAPSARPPVAQETRDQGPPPQVGPRSAPAAGREPRLRKVAGDEQPPVTWQPTPSAAAIHTAALAADGLQERAFEALPPAPAGCLGELDQAHLSQVSCRSRANGANFLPSAEGGVEPTTDSHAGIAYPEWDFRLGGYRENATRVSIVSACTGSLDWVGCTLSRHAGILHEMKRRLGAIRPDRRVLKGQAEGDDIDCDALVAERGETRAGRTPPGAVYQNRRPAPRRIALALLIDASASTNAVVDGHHRIIDVEKEAALVAASALSAAGIEFAALAFSGEGPMAVHLQDIKGFDAPWDEMRQRRIAGLETHRYTRLGAAVRHASMLLAGRVVDHRLLLLFSDGRPNDRDCYASRYGIEDARQAIIESRRQRISPYCLTVDREGTTYLPSIFGVGGYTVVRQPQQLASAFVHWLRQAARQCK